jgi:hypothetical protein
MQLEPALIVVLFAAVVATFWYLRWKRDQERKRAMQALAHDHGWTWYDEDDRFVRDDGAPFGQGRSRRAENVLVGTHRGRQIVAYDYQYKTDSGSGERRSTRTHEYAIWLVTLPYRLPHLEVRPEGIFGGRVAAALGFGDLEVESEAFNQAYRVDCDDDRYGTAMIHPRMMELLLSGASREVNWRIEGDVLISWERGHADPAALVARLDLLADIISLVPSFVWKDFGSPGLGTSR